jgi:hypothetical protein
VPAITLRPLDTVPLWKIENDDVAIAIEQDTGFIRSMLFKEKNVDLFQQVRQNLPGYIGGLRIYDERDEKWYSDLNDAFQISNAAKNGNAVSFTKHFSGAPFSLNVTLNLEAEALHWEVEAVKSDRTVADRSLRVYFFVPLIAGWDFWAPAFDAQFTFDGMSSFEYMYVQIPYVSNKEVILPMVSHYSPQLDVGFSMLEPIDARVPAAKFQFSNGEKCFNWGAMKKDIRAVPVLEAVNYYIGLTADRPMQTKIMLMFHEGDWRPGVGKVFKRWKEYFVPNSDTIYKYEGTFTCEGIQTADDLKRCKDFGIKTLEVHGHFEHYSDYFQDGKDSWINLQTKEGYFHKHGKKLDAYQLQNYFDTHTDEQIAKDMSIPVNAVRHRRSDVKARLAKLSKAGIGLYWYFNYTDGFRPIVEQRFADAIARNEDGSYQPSGWHMCHNMNADPKFSFGKFMIESAEKIFKTYPMLNGFFLDCFRHFEIDFAHDDGVTVVNNKPAYSMNFSYDDIEHYIRKNITKKNRATFANKPQSIRSMHYADGVLLEGDGNIHEEKFFWACIGKPLFFMWTSNAKPMDENLRRAVYAGSFPKFDSEKKKTYEQNKALFQRYLPLYEAFRRRVLCFEPDPLRAPSGSRGRLFTVGNDYVAGIITDLGGEHDKITYKKTPYAAFRIARGHDIGKAGVMVPGDKKFRSVKFKFDGTMVYVPLDGYKNCAVVKLFATRKTGKKIGDGKFQKHVDYCGDPESSFSERNER